MGWRVSSWGFRSWEISRELAIGGRSRSEAKAGRVGKLFLGGAHVVPGTV